MLEKVVEDKLKRLETYGFEVLKLRTPGYNGTKDRCILWPRWAPSLRGPVFVEAKKPGKDERALQIAVRDDWRTRGCDVRPRISTPEEARKLVYTLLYEAVERYCSVEGNSFDDLPPHIQNAYRNG